MYIYMYNCMYICVYIHSDAYPDIQVHTVHIIACSRKGRGVALPKNHKNKNKKKIYIYIYMCM